MLAAQILNRSSSSFQSDIGISFSKDTSVLEEMSRLNCCRQLMTLVDIGPDIFEALASRIEWLLRQDLEHFNDVIFY